MSEAHLGQKHEYASRGEYSAARLAIKRPCPYGCGLETNHGAMTLHVKKNHEFACKAGGCTGDVHKAKGYCYYHWRIDKTARDYGLTFQDLIDIYNSQLGCCRICGVEGNLVGSARESGREILFHDHCHKKGHFRGLLCSECNFGLGKFKDDPALLRLAAEYLEST